MTMNPAICYLFSFLIEAVMLWYYANNLFLPERSKKKSLATLCLLYSVLFAASLFQLPLLNTGLYLLANYIFFLTQYKIKWYAAFFHSLMITAILGMCELIIYGIILCFSPHFFDEASYFYNLAILTILSKILFFTTIYLLILFFKGRSMPGVFAAGKQYDKSARMLIWIPLTSLFVMLTFISIGETVTFSQNLKWMITSSALLLLLINLLVFGINQYNQKKSIEFTEMQLLLQKESDRAKYYEMLGQQYENQRIFIHDIKKHLNSIDILNTQGDRDKITCYIQQLIRSSDLRGSVRLCDNDLLNSILNRYTKQCAEQQILFHVDIRSQTTDFISNSDLTSLFCNLLDNAIEACRSVSDAYIELCTTKKEHTPFVILTMVNSCRSDPFSPEQTLLTRKPNKKNHGFGIKSIKKTLSRYQGEMKMYYNNDTGTFHTIITLKK